VVLVEVLEDTKMALAEAALLGREITAVPTLAEKVVLAVVAVLGRLEPMEAFPPPPTHLEQAVLV
jgi:hypothetical protein